MSGGLYPAFIYLAGALVAVPLAKRFGLGSVLGYLLAGVVIGPFVLRLVDSVGDVMHFAEFGVVMMLFLIGLELRPGLLWRMRGPILGMGGCRLQARRSCSAPWRSWPDWRGSRDSPSG
jgi:Kef-type K+ transport system membrane component KefB